MVVIFFVLTFVMIVRVVYNCIEEPEDWAIHIVAGCIALIIVCAIIFVMYSLTMSLIRLSI